MAFSFGKNLIDLLPPVYKIQDETGDLAAFLAVPAPTLDELKALIDRFPLIFDVDQCEARLLPYLAALAGMAFDGSADPASQRRRIKEAVPIYRRKATIPAIGRSLAGVGWQGETQETFRSALRLGSRSVLNGARLPGEIYSLGVYRIVSLTQATGARDALAFHHPAGTRAFFWQWLLSQVTHRENLDALEKLIVRRVVLGELDEAFDLNRTRLGSCFHLTRKQRAFNACAVTSGSALESDFDRAAVCLASWHGRGDRMRLGKKALNTRMLASCWESERKFAACCEIQAQRQPAVQPTPMRLNAEELGQALLNHANAACRIRFRQKDFYGVTPALAAISAGDGRTIRKSGDASLGRWFRVGRSRVSSDAPLSGNFNAAVFISACKVGVERGGATEAWDVVSRWRRRGPAFTLGAHALNGRYLTDANLTQERACFELRIETGASRRGHAATLRLGRRELNQTGLRLSVDRARPLRLGRMALNQSGPRSARPDLAWRFRQKDDHAPALAGLTAAATRFRVTRWPR